MKIKTSDIISLVDLKKSYFLDNWDEVKVLNWIDLKIKNGEFVAIMWESWSWKTTLLNVLWFLHPLTFWNYFLEWEDVSDLKDDDALSFIRNKKIWFIFQQFYLLPRLTCLENIILPAAYRWSWISLPADLGLELLDKVWLKHKAYNYPWELSGWQQQRVAIARSLINDPELILADEPTWNLDSETTLEIMKLISSLNNQWKTIIMVTHTKEAAKFADRVIYLKDWKVLSSDYMI